VLSEDTIEGIKLEAQPISELLLQSIMSNFESEIDEFSEFIPCFRLPDTDQYIGLIYWKASLLKYEYVLVTLNSKSYQMISRKVICGTIVSGEILKKSAAYIDEERIIHISAGAIIAGNTYDPANSQAFYMEIMEDGTIIFHNEENSEF
jgi:hypothetical protein